ncbi:MFS transporter [Kroppenstedtia eburnea]|uniref:MFS transporter, DHA2 family, metal-tetracycline-proton antiporter n=1 Tax=Kroppenstedtia eburnea TaxID=714067 RepID=A0A1N7MCR2_9BACL|nr:MFS transporter, DHA2 family, metal-tetracycline-proton antiporter [Kroppenstedtia eburnea]
MGSDTRGTAFTKVMESTVELHIGDKFIRTMVFTMVISMMSATMFNIVLPEISQEYELTYRQVSWVSSAYLLVYAIGSMIYGKLSDRYRLKSLLTMGLLLLSVGSLIGLVAQNYWMVLLSRIIQATGASVIPALAMVVPARYIPTERRGKVLGIMASGLAFGGVLGPIASAVVANFAHWRWLFVIPLTTLIALPLFRRYLVSEKVRSPIGMDWIGGFLLGGAVASLLLAVTGGRWLLAIVAIALILLFVARICSAAQPFVEPRLFYNGRYSLGIILAFLVSAIGFSIPFLTPIMLDDIYNLTPGTIGLVMVPASLTAAFLGKPGGKLADKKGNTLLFLLASLLLLSAFLLLSMLIGRSLIFVAVALIVGQVGQTFIVVAMSGTVANTLVKEQVGVGMGLMSMLNFIASSMSGALISSVVDQDAQSAWNPFHLLGEGKIYSNFYLILSLSYIGLILIYIIRFGYRTPLSDQQK